MKKLYFLGNQLKFLFIIFFAFSQLVQAGKLSWTCNKLCTSHTSLSWSSSIHQCILTVVFNDTFLGLLQRCILFDTRWCKRANLGFCDTVFSQ